MGAEQVQLSRKPPSFTASKLWVRASAAIALGLCAGSAGAAEVVSGRAAAAVQRWEEAVHPVLEGSAGAQSDAGAAILAMAEADQAARRYLWVADDPELSEAERLRVREVLFARMEAIDLGHAQRLRTLLPKDGWFRNSRDGVQVTHGAWLLLQHSRDTEFMERVLGKMSRLVRKREVSPHDYALLYDRVSRRKGGKQRYGSQAMCRPGKGEVLAISDLEEPERVDERREKIGWETSFAETQAALQVGKPCQW